MKTVCITIIINSISIMIPMTIIPDTRPLLLVELMALFILLLPVALETNRLLALISCDDGLVPVVLENEEFFVLRVSVFNDKLILVTRDDELILVLLGN